MAAFPHRRDVERVALTLGCGDGLGHDVYASGPAGFVETSFEVVGATDFGFDRPLIAKLGTGEPTPVMALFDLTRGGFDALAGLLPYQAFSKA